MIAGSDPAVANEDGPWSAKSWNGVDGFMYFARLAASGGLLMAAALSAGYSSPSAARGPRPVFLSRQSTPPDGDTADRRITQALSRLTFGARPGDADRLREMGVDKWIELQLNPERVPDRAVDQFVSEHYPALAMSAREIYDKYPPANVLLAEARDEAKRQGTAVDSAAIRRQARQSGNFVAQILSARVARAVMSERQLNEMMVDFWLNHFSVFIGKGQTRYFLASYEREAIRPYALGHFRDLLGAVAHSPAMLFYLDNVQSVADSDAAQMTTPVRRNRRRTNVPDQQRQRRASGLNENYARELLELHTLGVDGGYTQHDVTEVARAFTGWGIVPPRGEAAERLEQMRRRPPGMVIDGDFLFRPDAHDAGAKTVLGHRLAAGRGTADGEQVLDIIAAEPSTARFIAQKLVTRFVSDEPPDDLVDRAAATFMRTDGDIREVMRTIITSPEFFADDAYRAKVKTPFEVVVSALRAVGAEADLTARTAQMIGRLGQPIFGRETPDGWPDDAAAWMNTGAILNRINFGLSFAAGRVPGVRIAKWPVAESLSDAPREEQVDGIVAALLADDASADTRAILLSGNSPLSEQAAAVFDTTDVSQDSLIAPANEMMAAGRSPGTGERTERRAGAARRTLPFPTLTGVAQIIGLALGSPEFQRK